MLAFRRLLGMGAGEAGSVADLDRSRQKWVIEPVRVGMVARAQELWRYRRVLWFLAGRRIKERYESTTLGIFWLFARPLIPVGISTVIFGILLAVPSDGIPYFLFLLAGQSCWRIFERSVFWSSRSLDQNRGLIKKVYFPRLIAPMSSVAPAVTEFLILLALLVLACAFYYFRYGALYLRIGFPMLLAPLAVAWAVLLAISVGLWTSVFQVKHKDVQFGIRYFTQFWQYVTPVLYPLSSIPEKWRLVAYMNPMTPVVEIYKWGLLGIGEFPGMELFAGIGATLIIFGTGVAFFSRSEAASVDRL